MDDIVTPIPNTTYESAPYGADDGTVLSGVSPFQILFLEVATLFKQRWSISRGRRRAKLAADTGSDTGLRFERIKSLEESIRATERRMEEISRELAHLEQEPLDVDHLRRTIREFDDVWGTLTVREQEQMVKLLVSKVVYDGVTGKVTISFRSAGAKELCQGRNE